MSENTYRVEPLYREHLPGVKQVLAETFPESIVVRWGGQVLDEFLVSFIREPGAIGLVCRRDEEVAGFLLGCEDAAQHRRDLILRCRAPLVLHAPLAILRSPGLIGSLVRRGCQLITNRVRPSQEPSEGLPPASLILVGVSEAHRGQGLADQLITAFLAELARRRVPAVKLAVNTSNEPALRVYLAQGWQMADRYRAPSGAPMHRMVFEVPVEMASVDSAAATANRPAGGSVDSARRPTGPWNPADERPASIPPEGIQPGDQPSDPAPL